MQSVSPYSGLSSVFINFEGLLEISPYTLLTLIRSRFISMLCSSATWLVYWVVIFWNACTLFCLVMIKSTVITWLMETIICNYRSRKRYCISCCIYLPMIFCALMSSTLCFRQFMFSDHAILLQPHSAPWNSVIVSPGACVLKFEEFFSRNT